MDGEAELHLVGKAQSSHAAVGSRAESAACLCGLAIHIPKFQTILRILIAVDDFLLVARDCLAVVAMLEGHGAVILAVRVAYPFIVLAHFPVYGLVRVRLIVGDGATVVCLSKLCERSVKDVLLA